MSIGSTNISFSEIRHKFHNIINPNAALTGPYSQEDYTLRVMDHQFNIFDSSFYNDNPNPGRIDDNIISSYSFALKRSAYDVNISGNAALITYEFVNPQVINKYKIWARASSGDRRDEAPKEWEFRGAASKSDYESGTYVTLDTVNGLTTSDWTQPGTTTGRNYASNHFILSKQYSFSNTNSYKYYVLRITENCGDSATLGIGEVVLYGNIDETSYGGAGRSTSTYTVYAMNNSFTNFTTDYYGNSSNALAQLHDNIIDYNSFALKLGTGTNEHNLTSSNPVLIGYELNSSQIINKYRIWSRASSGDRRDEAPSAWELRASSSKSNYESGTYTTLDTVSGVITNDWRQMPYNAAGSQLSASDNLDYAREYTFYNTTSYVYYVLYITRNCGDASTLGMGEFAIYNSLSDISPINVSLSSFRKVQFTSGNEVPSTGEISINDDFKNRTLALSSLSGDLGASDNQYQLFTGNQGTGLLPYTIDLSDSSYFSGNSSQNSLIGKNVHIYLRYVSGSDYRNDPQLYKITVNGIEHSVGLGIGPLSYSNWKTTYRTTNTSYNHSSTWYTVTSSKSPTGRWHRVSDTPPSSGTGVTTSEGSIYYEGSSGGYNLDVYLRSPEIELTSDEVILKMYGYGLNMGTMYMGVYIL